jgi:hypothetical protein
MYFNLINFTTHMQPHDHNFVENAKKKPPKYEWRLLKSHSSKRGFLQEIVSKIEG